MEGIKLNLIVTAHGTRRGKTREKKQREPVEDGQEQPTVIAGCL